MIIRLEKFSLKSPYGYKHICHLFNSLDVPVKIGVATKRHSEAAVELFWDPQRQNIKINI
jgi:hypothetical protein